MSIQQISESHAVFDSRDLGGATLGKFVLGKDYAMDEIDQLLPAIGVGFERGVLEAMAQYAVMDSNNIQQPLTVPSVAAPIQFLQNWLPGFVEIVTAKRQIDELVSMNTIGSWEDQQIVQQLVENTGTPQPYNDLNNTPLSNWNQNFITRDVVRFELGMRVGIKEEAVSARVRMNTGEQKRKSAALQLEVSRNAIGFYGYNDGNGLTYGFLNDPNLPAYQTVANTNWSTATFLEIQADLLTALQTLRTQSQEVVDPGKTPITLAISTNRRDYLSTPTDFGYSVWAWLKEFYPNVRVVSAPQLNGANGGANVFYMYADMVEDSGTDDHRTFIQVVPAKFQVLGVQKLTKGYEEAYTNATAGIMLKRPYAVVRFSGI